MEDGTQVALQGVHALLAPGVYPLRLEATLPDGSKQSYEQNILIVSGNYPDDPLLYVDPITIDPAETEPELNNLINITSVASPEKFWTGDFYSPASHTQKLPSLHRVTEIAVPILARARIPPFRDFTQVSILAVELVCQSQPLHAEKSYLPDPGQ